MEFFRKISAKSTIPAQPSTIASLRSSIKQGYFVSGFPSSNSRLPNPKQELPRLNLWQCRSIPYQNKTPGWQERLSVVTMLKELETNDARDCSFTDAHYWTNNLTTCCIKTSIVKARDDRPRQPASALRISSKSPGILKTSS